MKKQRKPAAPNHQAPLELVPPPARPPTPDLADKDWLGRELERHASRANRAIAERDAVVRLLAGLSCVSLERCSGPNLLASNTCEVCEAIAKLTALLPHGVQS